MKNLIPLFATLFIVLTSCSEKDLIPGQKDSAAVTVKCPDYDWGGQPDCEAVDTCFHDGDLIFQSSASGQSQAIQLATHSKYSHCGLLFNDKGEWFVYEAVQPVKKTPFLEWIKHGDNEYYVVKRLREADHIMTKDTLNKMRNMIHNQMGKDYDLAFDWNDDKMYCSELVWKAYKSATGLEIGKTKPLADYDLSNPIVKKKLQDRYGNNIPKDEPMISPGSIFESELLVTVRQ